MVAGVMGTADRGKIANLLTARPPRRNPYVRAARVLFLRFFPVERAGETRPR